jgi:hypothetical protein
MAADMAKLDQDLGGKLAARVEQRDGATWVTLAGPVTEVADFAPLLALGGPLRIDLSAIDRINSLGVRSWINFVRACEAAGVPVSFERCAPVMVQQISMISNFMGARSQLRSLFVPYLCPACNTEGLELLELAPGVAIRPTIPCPKCPTPMQVDELEDMYIGVFARLAAR